MTRLRLFALAALAALVLASDARADLAPIPLRRGNPYAKDDTAPPSDAPRKSAPGLCGTGAGLSLAGIAGLWGVLRAGRRVAQPRRPR